MAQFCLEEALVTMIRLIDARVDHGMGDEADLTPPAAADPVLAGQLERQRIFAQAAE